MCRTWNCCYLFIYAQKEKKDELILLQELKESCRLVDVSYHGKTKFWKKIANCPDRMTIVSPALHIQANVCQKTQHTLSQILSYLFLGSMTNPENHHRQPRSSCCQENCETAWKNLSRLNSREIMSQKMKMKMKMKNEKEKELAGNWAFNFKMQEIQWYIVDKTWRHRRRARSKGGWDLQKFLTGEEFGLSWKGPHFAWRRGGWIPCARASHRLSLPPPRLWIIPASHFRVQIPYGPYLSNR